MNKRFLVFNFAGCHRALLFSLSESMKKSINIIIYAWLLASAILLGPFVLMTSDYDPIWLQWLPYRVMGSLGLFSLPITALGTIYFIIACAIERKWKYFAYSFVGAALIVISMQVTIERLSTKSIYYADRLALQLLNENVTEFSFQIDDDVSNDLRSFREHPNAASIYRMSALPPYSRYDYVIFPQSSAPFIMAVFKQRRSVLIYKSGLDSFLKYRASFVRIN